MKTTVISSLNESFLSDFERLLQDNAEHTINQLPDWISIYAKHYLQHKGIYFLAVFDGSRLVGCLPMQWNGERIISTWRTKGLVNFGKGPSDFFNIIMKRGAEEAVLRAITRHFAGNRSTWDTIDLEGIPAPSFPLDLFGELLKQEGLDFQVDSSDGYYEVDTTRCWDNYFQEYVKPHNTYLLRDVRRAERAQLDLHIEKHRNGIFPILQGVLHLYQERREIQGQANLYDSDKRQLFVRDILDAFEKKGMAELSLLKDKEGEVLAFYLDWLHNGVRYHWNTAYNHAYSRYSPGKVLALKLMEDSFQDPSIKGCNHMHGLQDYKRRLADAQSVLLQIRITNPSSLHLKMARIIQRLRRQKAVLHSN